MVLWLQKKVRRVVLPRTKVFYLMVPGTFLSFIIIMNVLIEAPSALIILLDLLCVYFSVVSLLDKALRLK